MTAATPTTSKFTPTFPPYLRYSKLLPVPALYTRASQSESSTATTVVVDLYSIHSSPFKFLCLSLASLPPPPPPSCLARLYSYLTFSIALPLGIRQRGWRPWLDGRERLLYSSWGHHYSERPVDESDYFDENQRRRDGVLLVLRSCVSGHGKWMNSRRPK